MTEQTKNQGNPNPLQIVIYTRQGCGYCERAIELLNKKKVHFENIDAPRGTQVRQEMESRTNTQTVPQIFVNGVHIGDCEQLYHLEQSGQLDKILGKVS